MVTNVGGDVVWVEHECAVPFVPRLSTAQLEREGMTDQQ